MYVGVDCGTQSTKVVVVDAHTLEIRGEGAAPHAMTSGENGRREQQPHWWVEAFETAFAQAVGAAGISPRSIRGIGVSGQQHGLVALDRHGEPVYPAKLWCDTETAPENEALVAQLGGERRCLETLGVIPQAGFTASTIAWLRRHRRDAYDAIDALLLPHDYLNYYLTGRKVSEQGDASGTGYFDTRVRRWHVETLAAIAPELDGERVLPELLAPEQPAGVVCRETADRLGLGDKVTVSAGGGDNMMGAIGTGNIRAGMVTMSLGSSGTIFAHSDKPAVSAGGLVANFCASHGGWLPLICTMNVTTAAAQIRDVLGLDVAGFGDAAASAPIGAAGIRVFPFFNGERVPALPEATGSFFGLSRHNLSAANLCRATLEGATFGLRYGIDLLAEFDIAPVQLRLVGGGAKSAVWRRIVADVMNTPVICPTANEAAAFGGALQARWCNGRKTGDSTSLQALCEAAIGFDAQTECEPMPENVERYETIYRDYQALLSRHYGSTAAP